MPQCVRRPLALQCVCFRRSYGAIDGNAAPVAKDKSVVKEDADDADADADAVHGIRAALAGDAAAAAADDDDDDLDDGPGKACSVCLEKFVAGDSVIALPSCIHIFHADCICAWLKTQFVCAECSVPIV
jgi:hypothetical protein